jgi:hypothetical protein
MPLIGQFSANFSSAVRCLYTCAEGFYSNSHYHSTQTCAGLCPIGHYCGEATTTPLRCPVGTYQPLAGARTLDSCIRRATLRLEQHTTSTRATCLVETLASLLNGRTAARPVRSAPTKAATSAPFVHRVPFPRYPERRHATLVHAAGTVRRPARVRSVKSLSHVRLARLTTSSAPTAVMLAQAALLANTTRFPPVQVPQHARIASVLISHPRRALLAVRDAHLGRSKTRQVQRVVRCVGLVIGTCSSVRSQSIARLFTSLIDGVLAR